MLLQPLCRARLHVWGHAGGRGRGAALSPCAPCPCANSGVCPAGVRSATDSPVEPGRSSRLRHGVGGCQWPCGHAVSLFPQQRGRCDCPAGGWWSSWGPQHRGGGRTGSVGSATVLGPEWAGLPASELASGRVTAGGPRHGMSRGASIFRRPGNCGGFRWLVSTAAAGKVGRASRPPARGRPFHRARA